MRHHAPILLLALFPTALRAQSARTAEQVVVTATGVPTPSSQIAAGVTVIDRATIERRGYTDLVEALSAVPGLRVAQSGGPGSQASVFIRGTNSNHVLVLRDGIAINDPADPGGAFNFGDDTLNDIERIEIIRGPMSGLYGSGAIGGVINLITRKAAGPLHGEVTLAGGSQNTGLARANVSGSSGIWDIRASAEGLSTRGFDQTPPRESVFTGESDGEREKLGTIELGVTPVEGTRVSLMLRGRDAKYGYDEQGFINTYDGGNATGYDASVNGRLGVVSHFFDDVWTTSLTLARIVDDRHYTVTANPADINGDTANDTYHGRRSTIDWNNTIRLPDLWHVDGGAVTIGYQHVNDNVSTKLNESFSGFPYASTIGAHDDTDAGSAGAQARVFDRLTLTGQMREDATTIAGNAFTWRAGGVFDISELDTRLRASYGTGFRAPALFDRYGVDSDGFVGNPDLRPEYSQGWEAGVSTDLPFPASLGTATAGVTYFDNRIHDLIEFVFAPLYTVQNVQQARAKGIEATLSLRTGTWLTADFGYTYTDARNLQTDALLLRRPENAGFADLRITPWPAFTLVPELTYTGRFEDYVTNDLGEPGFSPALARSGLILNLNLTWQATPHVAVFIWGKNLGGSAFEPVSGYLTPGTSALIGTKVSF